MAKNSGSITKKYRRLGMRPDVADGASASVTKALSKRNYPPGLHGPKGHRRMTDYGLHLQEKQRARLMYNISEKQLRNLFKKATKAKGDSGIKFIELLETRFDNVIFRIGLAVSRRQARQLVSHGLFLVNNKKLNVPSYAVKAGDVITIKKEKSLEKGPLAEGIKRSEKGEYPEWLMWEPSENKGQVLNLPTGTDLEVGIDTRLIVEYYSK